MKHIYFFLLFCPLVFSCGNKNESGNKPPKTTEKTTAKITDSITPQPLFNIQIDPKLFDQARATQKKTLEFLFGKTHAIELLSGTYSLNLIKTDADLYACYHFLDSVCNVTTEKHLNNGENYQAYTNIDSVQDLYKSVSDLLPYLRFVCEAECSMNRVMIDYNLMATLAKRTSGEGDDRYFELYHEIFGDSNDDQVTSAVWFDMTWDYGGNTLLGSGNHAKVLQHAQRIKKDNVFLKEIEKWENMCLEDALTWNSLFYTADKAIAELKKIMALEIGQGNKKPIEERIKKLESPSSDIQLDCEHKQCSYG